MLRILWNSTSGMVANQDKLDAISNNLANMQTDGYKRVDVSFKSLMSETLNRTGYPITNNPSRAQDPYTGTGVRADSWYRDNSQGVLLDTKNPSDLAIEGNGYYRVTTPDGQYAYTRSGAFIVDVNGTIVDSRGNKLDIQFDQGFSGDNVKFTKENLLVDKTGNVFTNQNGETVKVGRIPLFDSIGSNAMLSVGESLYMPVDGAQVHQVENSLIHQGLLEGSNVDASKEFSDLIMTQRAFQLSSKGIKTADEMWGMVNNLRGK